MYQDSQKLLGKPTFYKAEASVCKRGKWGEVDNTWDD